MRLDPVTLRLVIRLSALARKDRDATARWAVCKPIACSRILVLSAGNPPQLQLNHKLVLYQVADSRPDDLCRHAERLAMRHDQPRHQGDGIYVMT